MSRIFDALRKSEKQLPEESFVSPDAFLETMEKARSVLEQVQVERARILPESRVMVYSDPKGLGAERYRLLRARLGHWQAAKKIKTLLLTSALPREGKSLAAVNLATVLAAREGCSVLLLEGDLRRARLRPQLGLLKGPGLSECLRDGADPLSVIRRIEPLGFYLLPAGAPAASPVELLQSQSFTQVVRSLVSLFDWILIDSPPVSPLADTSVLKAQADATLLVVRAGVTLRETVGEAVQLLGADHVIGIILNGADGMDRSYYRYYRYGAQNGSGKSKKGKTQKETRKRQ